MAAQVSPREVVSLMSRTVPDWRDEALCAQIDPDLWFPDKGGSSRQARRMCARCPVRAECLADALTRDERYGIWGGLSDRERRLLKRRGEGR